MTKFAPINRYAHSWSHWESLPAANGKWVTYEDHVSQIKQILVSLMVCENQGDTHDLMDRVRQIIFLPPLEGDYQNGWSDDDEQSVEKDSHD